MTREEAWRNAKGYLYDVLSGEEADEIIKALEQEPCTDLCKSCDTKGCIFQSGIKREKCDFYTSEKR